MIVRWAGLYTLYVPRQEGRRTPPSFRCTAKEDDTQHKGGARGAVSLLELPRGEGRAKLRCASRRMELVGREVLVHLRRLEAHGSEQSPDEWHCDLKRRPARWLAEGEHAGEQRAIGPQERLVLGCPLLAHGRDEGAEKGAVPHEVIVALEGKKIGALDVNLGDEGRALGRGLGEALELLASCKGDGDDGMRKRACRWVRGGCDEANSKVSKRGGMGWGCILYQPRTRSQTDRWQRHCQSQLGPAQGRRRRGRSQVPAPACRGVSHTCSGLAPLPESGWHRRHRTPGPYRCRRSTLSPTWEKRRRGSSAREAEWRFRSAVPTIRPSAVNNRCENTRFSPWRGCTTSPALRNHGRC